MAQKERRQRWKKVKEKLLVIVFVSVFSVGNFAIAAEIDTNKLNSDLLKKEVDRKASSPESLNMQQIAYDLLERNVRKHRDSSLYKLILVNDKISTKYQNLNYRINKLLKYKVDIKLNHDIKLK